MNTLLYHLARIRMAVLATMSLFAVSIAGAGLIHEYQLNATYADIFGGPSVVPGGPFGVGNLTANGYAFGPSQGLSLSNALPNNANYSILLDFRFTDLNGYRKIVDFLNFTSDTGLYDLSTALDFFNVATGPDGTFQPNVLVRLVITRDGTTGQFSGYVNGVLTVQFNDSSGLGIFSEANNIIQFFNDDTHTAGNESSAGFVTHIAIYDTPLTAAQVAALGGPAATVDNIAYMTVYGSGDFGTINLTTGAFTLLGNSGQTLAGLGVINGVLYGTSLYGTNAGSLYTVNPASGSLTLVGASGISYDQFGSTTQGLYAIGSDANLYSINSTTGAATLIGPTGISLGGWRNMSCNAATLYASNGANLYTLNTTTGAASLVGNMGGPQIGAIVLENGILYAGQETPGARVDILDPSTGAATVGPTVTGASSVFDGLAPYPLTASAPLPGQIFVTNNGTGLPGSGTTSEYTTDGATVNPSLVTGLGTNPEGIATSGRYLFILDFNGGKIGEYDATTGAAINASLVTGLNGPTGIALSDDGTNLYVTTLLNGDENIGKYTLGSTPGTITASIPSFVTGLQNPYGIAVSGSNLFVVNSAPAMVGGPVGVGEYDANTGATINATLITGVSAPASIAVSGTNLYLGNNHDRIGQYTLGATRGTITSSNPTFVTGLHEPAVAVLRGNLFVTNFMPGAGSGVIGEYDGTTGAPVNASLITLTQYPEAIAVVAQPLQLTTAVSRKTHGGAGTFDVPLPLSGQPGVECRSTGGAQTLVFTFSNGVLSGNASVTVGTGSVSGSPTFSGNTMIVNLTGVTDVQKITVTLSGVTDSSSQVLPDTAVSMNMLIGDTNGNKTVNASDVAQTKAQSGAAVTAANFREDINASGTLTASDIALVKVNAGHTLP